MGFHTTLVLVLEEELSSFNLKTYLHTYLVLCKKKVKTKTYYGKSKRLHPLAIVIVICSQNKIMKK